MHLIGATVEQSRPMLVCEAVAAITVSAVAGRLGAVAGDRTFRDRQDRRTTRSAGTEQFGTASWQGRTPQTGWCVRGLGRLGA